MIGMSITPSRTGRRALFLLTTDLVVPKKWTPGATAEQEGVHERAFGLDGVVQIVSGPGVQHLCQRDATQRGCCFVRPRSSSVTCWNRTRLSCRARANAATSCSGVSDTVSACGSF